MKLKLFSSETKAAKANNKELLQKEVAAPEGAKSEQRESVDGRGEEAAPRDGSSDEGLTRCAITKSSKDETVGLALRTSLSTKGIYVHHLGEGSKFETTELKPEMKICRINDTPCPELLSETITLLKEAEGDLVILASPNDETVETSTTVTAVTTNDTEIAISGNPTFCGFLLGMDEMCTAQEEDIAQLYDEEEVEEEKPEEEEEKPEEPVEEPKPEKKKFAFLKMKLPKKSKKNTEEPTPEPAASEEAAAEPALQEEQEATPVATEKTEKKLSFKMPSVKLSKKSKQKTEEKTEEPAADLAVEEAVAEQESTPVANKQTIKLTKKSADEPAGIALRNSKKTDGIYVYGIYKESRLFGSDLEEKMRVYSINGKTPPSCAEAIKMVKEATELELVVGPNDEEQPETPETLENEEEEKKEEESNGLFGWW